MRTSRRRVATTFSSPGCIIHTPIISSSPGRTPIDGRALAQALRDLLAGDAGHGGVELDLQVRHVVGHFRDDDLGGHALQAGDALLNHLGASLVLLVLRRVVELDEPLDRHQHAEHLFLVHLHATADGVAVGRRVGARGGDEVLAPEQQAGALRPADALAAGEDDEVEAHRRVLPQVLDRRHVGGAVVHRRRRRASCRGGRTPRRESGRPSCCCCRRASSPSGA